MFIPWNHKPVSVLKKTSADGTYTIPANQFARVTVGYQKINGTQSMSVNGSTIFLADRAYYSTQVVSSGSPSTSTSPTDFTGYVSASANPITANHGLTTAQFYIAGSRTWTHNAGGDSFTIHYNGEIKGSGPSEMWLKAGDTIALSGASIWAHVELYDDYN